MVLYDTAVGYTVGLSLGFHASNDSLIAFVVSLWFAANCFYASTRLVQVALCHNGMSSELYAHASAKVLPDSLHSVSMLLTAAHYDL